MHGPFEVVELRFPRVLEEKPVVYRSNSENCCERILLCTLLLVPSWKVQDFSLFVCLFVLVFYSKGGNKQMTFLKLELYTAVIYYDGAVLPYFGGQDRNLWS